MEPRDLVHLLYTARGRFNTIHVEWNYHYDPNRTDIAVERWKAQDPPVSVGVLTSTLPAAHAVPTVKTYQRRLWWQKPDCWRDEDQGMISIFCREQWWLFSSGYDHLTTNVMPLEQWSRMGIRNVQRGSGKPTWEDRLRNIPLADPSFLLASHDLQPLATVRHVGREATRVRGTPRNTAHSIHDGIFWSTADEYDLLVDKERGILLRYAARLDGQEFAVAEVEHVSFDEPIPQDVFSFSL